MAAPTQCAWRRSAAWISIHTPSRWTSRPAFEDVAAATPLIPGAVAIARNSRFAWVTLPQRNAMAILDLQRARFYAVAEFGAKDHSRVGAGLDASDRDGAVAVLPWPVRGLYQPSDIATLQRRGRTFLLTANRGAPLTRADEPAAGADIARVRELTLDPTRFPNADALRSDAALGRLRVRARDGDIDGDGDVDELLAHGARSFSIWSPSGALLFDSGDDFAQILAQAAPRFFNAQDGDPAEFDQRSDDRGAEPDSLAVGRVGAKLYAFIGLAEGAGGVMIYNVTDPASPAFAGYQPRALAEAAPAAATEPANGRSELMLVRAKDSPTRAPLLLQATPRDGLLIHAVTLGAE